MKVAAAAYPLDVLKNWQAYEDKMASWVREAATAGAELLVFPEYGAMELATLAGLEVAGDLEGSLHAVAERLAQADAIHAALAREHGVHILAGSGPAAGDPRPVNRARLITPEGVVAEQDKQIMTPWERDPWDVAPGGPLHLFDTDLGRIGVLICYDCEFPLLGRALVEADVLLIPSCTETLAGYWRVRLGAQARAMENQCFTVMSSLVGEADWSEAVETNTGAGGIFCPPDVGLPADGVMAVGQIGQPGWTFAELDFAATAHVRERGGVRNRAHWDDQTPRHQSVTSLSLRAKHP
ncbi:carbon-nitrogen hydrolase family protein [Aestuariivita boseongensis]|uniref:carbon-nitrogen hydrolase family protein n=1 Tax=Aestuariivita boseongensis TaxID=1470562 RepID=UPI0006803BC1|nr:carbon-nitrogen hydrolase family protein [Aestuariivita boseongensis]